MFNENVVSESSDFIKISVNRIKPQIIRAPIKNVIISDKHTAEALLHNFSKIELQFQNIYCVGRRTKRFVSNNIAIEQVARFPIQYEETISQIGKNSSQAKR